MLVTLQYATEHLAELALAAENGEDVEIARPERPPLKLIVSAKTAQSEAEGPRILGALRGQMIVPSEEEWRKMDEELADMMTHGSLFPPE